MDVETLRDARAMGFSDKYIGQLWGKESRKSHLLRKVNGNIRPSR